MGKWAKTVMMSDHMWWQKLIWSLGVRWAKKFMTTENKYQDMAKKKPIIISPIFGSNLPLDQ
jgi:hypothetical protein